MIKRAIAILLLAGLLTAALLISQWMPEPLKVSGFVEADEIRVGSRVGGRVQQVEIVEGQRVRQGDLLLQLEPYDLMQRRQDAAAVVTQRKAQYEKLLAGFREEEIAQAKAQRDRLTAYLEELRNGPRPQEIAAAAAELELAEAELALATREHARTEKLFGQGVSTREAMDEATTKLRVAQARVRTRKEQLELLKSGTRSERIGQAEAQLDEARQEWLLRTHGFRPEEIAEAKAAVEAAEASLEVIDARVRELRVLAPLDAVVEAVELHPGDMVAADAPIISLMDTSHLWVRAYVPEDALDLRIGQKVDVTVDSHPNRRFAGAISFVARQAEFTPGNVQTPEERSKQVFRIKVALTEGLDALRPGMAADVWLEPKSPGRQGRQPIRASARSRDQDLVKEFTNSRICNTVE